MTRTSQDFAAFLESLKVKNEGPEQLWGQRFDQPIETLSVMLENLRKHDKDRVKYEHLPEWIEYLIERIRRAESNAKPETLAEDVKAYMRAGLRANSFSDHIEFRRLSEPDKQGEG